MKFKSNVNTKMKLGFGSMVLLLTFMMLGQICSAGHLSQADLVAGRFQFDDGTGLSLNLDHVKAYDSKSYNDAIIFLEQIKGASSCHRFAATSLISTCQAIEGGASVDVELSEVKEEFAAKLAACELKAVFGSQRNAVPKTCMAFLPSKEACSGPQRDMGRLCYSPATRSMVSSCVSSLHANPQSWTSYSNALNNVQSTCQASRLAIEKDQLLEDLKTALSVASETNKHLQETFNEIISRTAAQTDAEIARHQDLHSELQLAVHNEWTDLAAEMADNTRRSFMDMILEFSTASLNVTSWFNQHADAGLGKASLLLEKQDLALHKQEQTMTYAEGMATTMQESAVAMKSQKSEQEHFIARQLEMYSAAANGHKDILRAQEQIVIMQHRALAAAELSTTAIDATQGAVQIFADLIRDTQLEAAKLKAEVDELHEELEQAKESAISLQARSFYSLLSFCVKLYADHMLTLSFISLALSLILGQNYGPQLLAMFLRLAKSPVTWTLLSICSASSLAYQIILRLMKFDPVWFKAAGAVLVLTICLYLTMTSWIGRPALVAVQTAFRKIIGQIQPRNASASSVMLDASSVAAIGDTPSAGSNHIVSSERDAQILAKAQIVQAFIIAEAQVKPAQKRGRGDRSQTVPLSP